jgi:hypothetical protein
MKKGKMEKTKNQKKCQKCNADIGGGSYYMVQLECIYDGNSLSACEKIVVCSECYHALKSWLNLS